MHILATTTASLDDLIEPVDLGQEPAEMVALSFTDSDLAGIAAAWRAGETALPSLRLASLRELRHPMSVDLWIDSVAAHAGAILVRVLGGYDWWRYGCDRLAETARRRGIALALLPGECSEADERLAAMSTLPGAELEALLSCFREGGPQNMSRLVARLAHHAGHGELPGPATTLPKAGIHAFGGAVPDPGTLAVAGRPVVPILFYRSMLLATDCAPIEALAQALDARGLQPLPIFVSSLKDGQVLGFVEEVAGRVSPAAIVATTAFAAGDEGAALFERIGVPVIQAVMATTRREAWEGGDRGLTPSDIAMHVVLPELDGRLLAGAVSFKAETERDAALGFRGQRNRPEEDRIAQVAERVSAMVRLRQTPAAERRLAILVPDYPGATGRAGYAVGLDVPSSVLAMLHDLKAAGYVVEDIPETPRALMKALERGTEGIDWDDYRSAFQDLPAAARERVVAAWGRMGIRPPLRFASQTTSPPIDGGEEAPAGLLGTLPLPRRSGERWPEGPEWGSKKLLSDQPAPGNDKVSFRATTFGNVTVALAPDRGSTEDRRADYHDPALPPRHELLAFGVWLRQTLGCHALVHVGAHGTLEWLPGKTVALSRCCFPEIVAGSLPVVYPFIVSNPGEAAQAKRRIGAVTIGHLPPPLAGAGLSEDQQALERLVDEYAQADGLDRRRRDRLAKLIVETATRTGLASDAGVSGEADPDAALVQIDAWLCDLKDFAIKDGLHIYGRPAPDEADPLREESAAAERASLLAALDGRHVRAGPAGAPARGRLDVLPTGRNLFASDPRTMPTPTAFEIGSAAADEVVRRYLQDHGEWPRALVLDLWGSASLRTGGEEIAQGLALMGCRPQWDPATGRVSGIEVLPPAVLGRPRIDVTFHISGLFRDMFPTQIALIDAAVAAVAARDEAPGDNPLGESARRSGADKPRRIFGTSPGTYGAGIEDLLSHGRWEVREEIGEAFLAANSHAYGGAEGFGTAVPGEFAQRVGEAELLVHAGDDPARDLLEGSADVAFIGGFAAAVAALGGKADLISLDTTDPARPKARSVAEAVTRIVRARALNPRFIEGQLRHGPRGASELAETVDRLVGFAETTHAVSGSLIDAVHDAYLGNQRVRRFLLSENPAAARAIAERLADARRRGLWLPRRNSLDNDLAELVAEARRHEAAA